MKRRLLPLHLRQSLLAVPAAALMLGAAEAGTTVGLNFQAWYYDSGAIPQTVGYGSGYQTTGFPVTARAFGVDVTKWTNTDPLDCQSAIDTSVLFGNGLTANIKAPNAWQSGIGELVTGWNPETVLPGNDEVTWGYLDDGNSNGKAPSVDLLGLSGVFTNGYVVQTIAAEGGHITFNGVDITDGVVTNSVSYTTYYRVNAASDSASVGGTVGLSGPSGRFTSDALSLFCQPKTAGHRSVLAGFIITDQPVVTRDPADTAVNSGSALSLSAGVIGLTNGLGYQWRMNGTPIAGATTSTYSKAVASLADAGSYDLVVTNLYGATTSVAATVTIFAIPSLTKDLTGTSATLFAGANFSNWSVDAAGGQPLSYQWRKAGLAIGGATNATLTLSNVQLNAAGDYSVTVTNQYGKVNSATNHLTVVASPNLFTTDVAQDGPGAYWPLTETNGAPTVADYSGRGNNGTVNGAATLGSPGPLPPAFAGFDANSLACLFDGGSSYIDCGTGPSISGTADFTLEAWINTTATANGMILQQRYANGFNGEYGLSVNASGNVNFYVFGGGAYQYTFTTSRTVNDGLWHHIAAVRSGSSGYIYVDGAVAASATGTPAPLDPTFTTVIGRDERDHNSYFNGSISQVAIYPAALSAHRLALHAYNAQFGTAPFSISTVAGGYIADTKPVGILLPGANHGATWTNAVADFQNHSRSGVEVFTGNSQVTAPGAAAFDAPSGTIMFWLQANAPIPGPGTEGAMLFDRRTTNGAVIVLHDDGSIFWQGQGGSRNTFNGGYVPDTLWHHVAVTYGRTVNDTISIYVDAALAASVTVTNGWSWPAGQQIELGASHDGYWKKFNGLLDDFRLYSRVLTPAEITSVYTSDALVDTATLQLRYNFDTSGVGTSLSWPVGALYSSPTLGSTAVWTLVPNAVSPYPFLAPGGASGTTLFYRAGF